MSAAPHPIELPAHPTGPDVARTLRRLRLAVHRGDVVLDPRALATWPAGARLALLRSQRRAERRGHRFDLAPRHDPPFAAPTPQR